MIIENAFKSAIDKFVYFVEAIIQKFLVSSIMQRLARGSLWIIFGTVISRIFTMVSTIVIARVLGKENYGEIGMVVSTITTFAMVAGFGLGITANKYVAELRGRDSERAGRIISLSNSLAFITSIILFFSVLIFAPWLSESIINRPSLAPIIRLGAVYLFLNTLRNVAVGSLAGFESFKSVARINIIEGISTPLTAIPFVFLWGVPGAVFSLILTSAIGYFFSRSALIAECRNYNIPLKPFNKEILKELGVLWKFSIPSLLSGLLVMPITWISNTILVNQLNGYAELGLFNAAYQWRTLLIFIPQRLLTVMLPILAETHSRENKADFLHTFNINIRVAWLIALPITVFTIIFNQPLAALFGNKYAGMEPIIVFLMLATFLDILNAVIGNALAGAGQMWVGTAMNAAWGIALIVSTYFFAPQYKAVGLSIAYLCAYFLHTLWQVAYVELSFAPSCIFKEWKLILITIATLIPASVLAYYNVSFYIANIFLLLLAVMPFIIICRDKMKNAVAIVNK